ncbi:hypothetical protein RADP37_05539 [Roseomonas mucosa]|uniref:Uncharacterized protein n=1 Tax=Roseomonas mucosa TaxID=207340 RepID=A0A4Y1MTX2_9PROT|nr:hypothetical protein RADP37_05539 [Roseomonas mucosa]
MPGTHPTYRSPFLNRKGDFLSEHPIGHETDQKPEDGPQRGGPGQPPP